MKDEVKDLRERTRDYALRIIQLYTALPNDMVSQTLGNQLLRAGTSVGAHYREANRSRSDAEVISKFGVAIQELDECLYWLELITATNIFPIARLESLCNETNELIAILTTCVKKVKLRAKAS